MASPALDPDVQAFRMPAEWEPHEATWLGWPHNLSDWPGRFAPIPWVYGEIVRKLAEGELRADPGAVEGARGEGAARPGAGGRGDASGSSSSASRATAAGPATSARSA